MTDTAAERLVTASDHAELSRLVTEHAWRVDHGRADTLHELYVDDGVLDVGTPVRGRDAIREWGRQIVAARRDGGSCRGVGSSCSAGATS